MTNGEEEQETYFARKYNLSNFDYALREEDNILLKKMLNECQKEEEYAKAFNSKGEYNSAESLLMALIYFSSRRLLVS